MEIIRILHNIPTGFMALVSTWLKMNLFGCQVADFTSESGSDKVCPFFLIAEFSLFIRFSFRILLLLLRRSGFWARAVIKGHWSIEQPCAP